MFYKKQNDGQIILEFLFCMIVVFLMVFSLVKVIRWTGKDYNKIVNKHEKTLKKDPKDLEVLFWEQKNYKKFKVVYNETDLTPE